MPQKALLFHRSIRENIAYGRPYATDDEVMEAGRTSIVVVHRLSTMAALDRIVVLEKGSIVEDGAHRELSQAGGAYAALWDRQTGAFLEGE